MSLVLELGQRNRTTGRTSSRRPDIACRESRATMCLESPCFEVCPLHRFDGQQFRTPRGLGFSVDLKGESTPRR